MEAVLCLGKMNTGPVSGLFAVEEMGPEAQREACCFIWGMPGAEGGIQRLKPRVNSARLWEEASNPDGDGGHRDGGGGSSSVWDPSWCGERVLGSLGG